MNRTAAAIALLLACSTALAAEAQKPAAAKKGKEQYAVFVTSKGKIAARLLPEETPNAVANFVGLATGKKAWTEPRTGKRMSEPLYDGTLFHRVIPAFMIQGGDPMSRGKPTGSSGYGASGPGYAVEDELSLGKQPFNEPCQLAMANSGPNTNGSQFFITEVATPHLNPRPCNSKSGVCGYVRFGVGICGCERVKQIAAAGASQVRLEKVLIVGEKPTCN